MAGFTFISGQLVLGQKVDDFSGKYEIKISFSGKITAFNIWNSVLANTAIAGIANCSGVPDEEVFFQPTLPLRYFFINGSG